MGTKTRFEEEAKGNSEMAYCYQPTAIYENQGGYCWCVQTNTRELQA